MSVTSKEAERAELHKTIWRIANDLRGSVDGWDFKTYVLGMLFYRFISENLTAYLNEQERLAGDPDFDYAMLGDADAEFGRAETVREKGFFILPSDLFVNVRERARRNANLNETLSRVFGNIEASAVGAASEDDLKGLFDDLDVNSNKLGPTVARRNEKLVKLMDAVGELKLGTYTDHTIDAFGDAYEYLMTMYASSAGKSGGEFFTPQEVSELLARITVVGKTEVNKVYDPACGSGSLLLKFAKVLGKQNVRQGFFGQEINLTTYNLCRINMFLHDIKYEKFDIAHGDTLTDPAHWDDEPFEAIVSNPPYSTRWEGDANPLLINDPRFSPAGVLAPKSKADLAFTMHMLSWLAVNGTAAIVEFPGVLYRGGAEQKIRKYLIDNNYVDTVIQLPPDLFFGVTIATCIIVLKKSKRDNKVLFIDASAEFVRGGNKNKLTDANQAKILDAFTQRTDVDYFATLVDSADLAANSYNIAVSQLCHRRRHPGGHRHHRPQRRHRPHRRPPARAPRPRSTTSSPTSKAPTHEPHPRTRPGALPGRRRILPLGELGELVRGNGMPKTDFTDSGVGCIHYGQIYTYYGTWATETKSFVAPTTAAKLAKVDPGDLVITNTSENLEDVCKAVAWLGDGRIATGGHATVLKHGRTRSTCPTTSRLRSSSRARGSTLLGRR